VSKVTSHGEPAGGGAGATRSTAMEAEGLASHRGPAAGPAARVLAVVKDLFFVARIRETARLVGVPLEFVRSADELNAALPSGARLILLDLTGGVDYDAVFAALERLPPPLRPPVLAYTTHALAKQTQQWHPRCDRVVTKETLTQELPALLRDGVAR
jgi:hypothetical protein